MSWELSPYFKGLARTPHPCPERGAILDLEGLKLSWDGAMWRCPSCGWFQLDVAPEAASLGPCKSGSVHIIRPRFGGK